MEMETKERVARSDAAARARRNGAREIKLALQGGAAHSAFSWGALDYLLEQQEAGAINITAVSGTSGGAINAALVAHGLQHGAPHARKLLHDFWWGNAMAAALSMNPFSVPVPLFGSWNIDYYPWVVGLNAMASVFSVFPLPQKSLAQMLLAHTISACIDFDALNRQAEPKIYMVATNARTGRWHTFQKGELTVDAVLASACLPNLFPAVMVGCDPHWDGGYLKDPGLFPLVADKSGGDDILIIGVNPFARRAPFMPLTPLEITDRLNELTFNSSLMAEVEKVLLVNDALSKNAGISVRGADPQRQAGEPGRDKKTFFMHYLEPPAEMAELGLASKNNCSYLFARYLFDMGRRSAARWWPSCADNLGKRHTDIQKIVDYKHVDQPISSESGLYQSAKRSAERAFGVFGQRWPAWTMAMTPAEMAAGRQ